MRETPDFSKFTRAADSLWEAASPSPAARTAPPMTLARVLEHIRRRLRLVAECIAIGGAISVAAGLILKPTFTATALLAVSEAESGAPSQATDSAVDTQMAMLQSQAFLERAFNALSADPELRASASNVTALERRLKVKQASKSRLFSVSFSARSPVLAADAVNRIVRLYVEDPVLQNVESVDDVTIQFSTRIKELEDRLAAANKAGEDAGGGAGQALQESLREQIASLKLSESLARRRQESRRQNLAAAPPVQLVALATPPMRRSSLNPLLIVGPGVLFSALVGVGLAAVLGRLDKRIHSREQFEYLLGRECAGEIPLPVKRGARNGQLAYTRALEALVTKTVLLPAARARAILIAASDAKASDAFFARDFAEAAARTLPRVLLIDLDISRAPITTHLFRRMLGRTEKAQGPDILDVVAGRHGVEDAIKRDAGRSLWVLPLRRPIVDDTFAQFSSDRLRMLLEGLRRSFSLVVIEGPPMGAMHEACFLASLADAALIYARCGASLEPEAIAGFEAAEATPGRVLLDGRRRVWAALTAAPFNKSLVEPVLAHGGPTPQFSATPVTAIEKTKNDPPQEAAAASHQRTLL
jgi:Mrp family chromosome partitioning ATPase/capsular polysaccharide biosynthesis protein